MVSIGIILVALAIIALLAVCMPLRSRGKYDISKIKKASGSLPIIGHLPLFLKYGTSGKLHQLMHQWFSQALPGDQFLSVAAPGMSFLLPITPTAIDAVVTGRGWQPKPRDMYSNFGMFGVSTTSMLYDDKGETYHRNLRKHFLPFFSTDNMTVVFNSLLQEVLTTCESCEATATSSAEASIDIAKVSHQAILQVVSSVFFEVDSIYDEASTHAFMDAIVQSGQAVVNPFLLTIWKLFPFLASSKRYRKNWKALNSSQTALVKNKWSLPEPAESSTVLWACLRRAFPDALTNPDSMASAVANVGLMIGAGFETTASAVSITLALLSVDREAMSKLEEELEQAGLLVTEERPTPRDINQADTRDLKWLEAICNESLRLFPPVQSGGARDLVQDMDVCGMKLPKGTTVMAHAWALHHSKSAWGEDASEFKPERWMGKAAADVKRDSEGFLRWIPFLLGPQKCIAQHLAMLELKLAVATFVSRLHISMDTEKMKYRNVQDIVEGCKGFLTLTQVEGIFLKVQPRTTAGRHNPR